MTRWFHERGSLARDGWEAVVDASLPDWSYAGLRVGALDGARALPVAGLERMLVPLSGAFEVRLGDGRSFALEGRRGVFDGPTDVVYLGSDDAALVRGTGRLAVAEAPASRGLPAARIARDDVPVEIRGAGASSRQVHGFGMPGALEAESLIVCEVVTPAGNWSSWPAHKHDEAGEQETRLEELYWFEVGVERGRPEPPESDPVGLFAAWPSPAGPIDLTAVVRTGDVALVPYGYHGPAGAPPGYDLYYLNVMAGPDAERAWRITDDPRQAWVRDTWAAERPDPRLPYLAEGAT